MGWINTFLATERAHGRLNCPSAKSANVRSFGRDGQQRIGRTAEAMLRALPH